MTVVVDASVALKWFVEEANSAAAERLQATETIIAPELIVAEVTNAMWKNVRMGRVAPAQLALAAKVLARYFRSLVPLRALCSRASQIALDLDHPVYDCFYIALAAREDAALVTADGRLAAKARGTAFEGLVRALVPST